MDAAVPLHQRLPGHSALAQHLRADWAFFPLGGLVGWFAWGIWANPVTLLCTLVIPFAWGMARTRWAAALLMLGYYLAGARGLPEGSVVFFGNSAPVWWGWSMWAVSSLLLSLPYVVLWTNNPRRKAAQFLLAIVLTALPPIGLIGWCSPIAVAGVVFPGLRWIGLGLTLCLFALLVARSRRWVLELVLGAVIANVIVVGVLGATSTQQWAGQDTEFPRLSGAGADDAGQRLAALARIEWVKAYVKAMPPNTVRVLPETILGPFDGIAEFALREAEDSLKANGSRLLVGAELPQANGQYKNALVVLGRKQGEDRAAVQGIPVPVAMWKPWASDGAVANPFGRDNQARVAGMRVGAIVCYEQVLPYSFLWQMLERPDVIAAVSNVWWARETSVPNIQGQMVNAFSRLFGVPAVTAKNI